MPKSDNEGEQNSAPGSDDKGVFELTGMKIVFDDIRRDEVIMGNKEVMKSESEEVADVYGGTSQTQTIYFKISGDNAIKELKLTKNTYKGPMGPFTDVIMLGDYDPGEHEYTFATDSVPDGFVQRGNYRTETIYTDSNETVLLSYDRRFKIVKGDLSKFENAANEEEEEEEESIEPYKLYKSSRFKGYITLLLMSVLNFIAATQSEEVILNNAVPASTRQRRYAESVAMISAILSFLILLFHVDHFTPAQTIWWNCFKPKSRVELFLIAFLVIWWLIATWIQTGIRGICGDGKGQYNLYFSTWICLWTIIWTSERWFSACGWPTMKQFLASWPNRAPGWIAILILSFADMLCFIDLGTHWEEAARASLEATAILEDIYADVSDSQWSWLIAISAITIVPSAIFVLAEIFRGDTGDNEQEKNVKSNCENILEGIILLVLMACWIATVVTTTIPGGAASQLGNAYFITWGCTVFVMETFIWWIHDWRKSIHAILRKQEEEYRKIQKDVLAKTRSINDSSSSRYDGPDDDINVGYNDSEHTRSNRKQRITPKRSTTKVVKFAQQRFESMPVEEDDDVPEREEDEEDNEERYYEAEDGEGEGFSSKYDGVIPDMIGT